MNEWWVVIDVGCHECGVDSEPVGIYATEAQAEAASTARTVQTDGWRDGGQTIAQVFRMRAPDGSVSDAGHKPFTDDGVTYCGWDGHEGCGEVWPCPAVRDKETTPNQKETA